MMFGRIGRGLRRIGRFIYRTKQGDDMNAMLLKAIESFIMSWLKEKGGIGVLKIKDAIKSIEEKYPHIKIEIDGDHITIKKI